MSPLTAVAFRELLQRMADAWAALDAEAATHCFAADAVYMQPLNEQLFVEDAP